MPESIKQTAVLNLIVIMPGNTLLKEGILKIHPARTRQPATMVNKLAALVIKAEFFFSIFPIGAELNFEIINYEPKPISYNFQSINSELLNRIIGLNHPYSLKII